MYRIPALLYNISGDKKPYRHFISVGTKTKITSKAIQYAYKLVVITELAAERGGLYYRCRFTPC